MSKEIKTIHPYRLLLRSACTLLLALFTGACTLLSNDSGSLANSDTQPGVQLSAIHAPDSATLGEAVRIEVTIRNTGASAFSGEMTITLSRSIMLLEAGDDNGENNSDSGGEANSPDEENIHFNIAVTNITTDRDGPDPAPPIQGDRVQVTITLENRGNQDVEEDILLLLEADGREAGRTAHSGGLTVGETTTVVIEWNTRDFEPGLKQLKARHTYGDDDDSDNSMEISMNLVEEVFDLAVSDLIRESLDTMLGETAGTTATIRNEGNRETGDNFTFT